MNYDSFGRVIAKQGDRVKITNRATGATLEGKVTSDKVWAERLNFAIQLDGTSVQNRMRTTDWNIELLPPEIEDGWYESKWNKHSLYRVEGDRITFLNATSAPSRSTIGREEFAREVRDGRLVLLKAVQS